MAGRADEFRDRLPVDDESSNLSDEVIAASFAAWLRELDEQVAVQAPVRAADTLMEARAAGEV